MLTPAVSYNYDIQTATCLNCGRGFLFKPQYSKGLFCSRECWSEYQRSHSEAIVKACLNCGSLFSVPPSKQRSKHTFCTVACMREYRAETGYGVRPSRLRMTRTCPTCGCTFTTYPSQDCHFCSKECYGKSRKGVHVIRKNAWGFRVRIKNVVIRRDGNVCRICGKENMKKGESALHHITPFKIVKNFELDNLVLLCQDCHKAVHKGKISQEEVRDAVAKRPQFA